MSVTETPTRKYALARIDTGDYMFLSNDGSTLWRVFSYEEEGGLPKDDGSRVFGSFWAVAWFDGGVYSAERCLRDDPEGFLTDARWITYAAPLLTRGRAIDEALRARMGVA